MAENGQQLFPGISKMSMKSPCGLLTFFGKRMLITAEFLLVKVTLSQVRVSKLYGGRPQGRISLMRKDPKKATQHAAQNNVLLSFSQELNAISWPAIFNI